MISKIQSRSSRALFLSCALLALFLTACKAGDRSNAQPPKAEALKVGENFVNPMGFYEKKPRFSWQLPVDDSVKFQSSFQIQVSPDDSFKKGALLWDSGKVISDSSNWIRYEGSELDSRQKVFWRVRYWNENNRKAGWSEPAFFELGLLSNSDWKGKWISAPDTGERYDNKFKHLMFRPQYLRREFSLAAEPISARLYITAKGVFKSYINGKRVGEDVMSPGSTPYAKRIETLSYDVTPHLSKGQNAIGAIVAEGWHSGRVFGWRKRADLPPPRFLAQLEVVFADGSKKVVTTDKAWRATREGPLRFASNYDGERYDANREMPGWNTPGFEASNWQPVIQEALDQNVALQPKRHTSVRDMLVIPAKSIVSNQDGVTVFDMGQNMVGVPEITVPARKGQEIKIRFAEALEKGEFYTQNYRSAHSTDYYLPSDDGVIHYKPSFTFHGFRYVEISGYDKSQTPQTDWVKGVVQYSNFDIYGAFESSHPKLNQLTKNVEWGVRGNFFDIPTDCPQRDERMGWTGDAQVFAPTSMYLADVYGFWAAWMQSLREDQLETGQVPNFIPTADHRIARSYSSGWGDAATVIPWELYQLTGDKTILRDSYDSMKKWLAFHASHAENYISDMKSYADWLQPKPVTEGKERRRGDTDKSLISTAYYARSVELTRNAARELGLVDEVAELNKLHRNLADSFRSHFFDDAMDLKNGRPTQTSYLLGISFSLFNEEETKRARKKLLALIAEADGHLRTGFLGTPLLAPVLEEAGRSDVMFDMLFKETYPSWFYSINQGATTTWERWNSYSITDGFNKEKMNSLNHYAYGAVAEWFYEGILGLKATKPGFKHYRIEPKPSKYLDWAKGAYPSPHGKIAIAWHKQGGAYTFKVTVAPNTTADLVLPTTDKASIVVNGYSLTQLISKNKDQRVEISDQSTVLKMLEPGDYSVEIRP